MTHARAIEVDSHVPRDPALPPGPTMPRFVQTWYFMRRPFAMLDDCVRRYSTVTASPSTSSACGPG
jgi:hypothetical protein